MRGLIRTTLPWLLAVTLGAGFAVPGTTASHPPSAPIRHSLRAGQTWRLDLPDEARFDASALLLLPDGALLTVNDKVPGVYRIEFGPENGTTRVVVLPDAFTLRQLAPLVAEKPRGHFDFEGLARDEAGRLLVCEEGRRWILRLDPRTKTVERLPIDWAPVAKWFSADPNASFEGLAVGGGKLYVANERSVGRIIVVDLATLKISDDFQVSPIGRAAHDIHYTDLCWFGGELWVLCRESRCVLRVNPSTHAVLAEFDYAKIETAPANRYAHPYPFGFVEGLAVDADNIWLAVDNNGFPRVADRNDRRPTLWRCPRPDRKNSIAPAP